MKTTQILFLFVFCMGFSNLNAQINLGKKVKNQTNNKANREVDQGINKGLNAVEDGVKGIFKKKNPNEQVKDSASTKQKQGTGKEAQNVKPASVTSSLQAYSKFDFIPGEKVVFYEDFSQDAVGDFPALWNTNGSAEVVTTNLFPGQWMKFACREAIWTDALLKLPENYTIEYDVIPVNGPESKGAMAGWTMRLMQARNVKAWDSGSAPGQGGYWFEVAYYGRPGYGTWLYGTECEQLKTGGFKEGDEFKEKLNQKYHIAIWVQKTRVRLYQNEDKLFDSPKAFPAGCVKPDRLRFEDGAAMISNIRIAIGAPDTRNKLMTEGKLVTYGIYFDVNKDVVKPESYGTLKDIATVLNEVPDVKVKIVGHTDSDGDEAKNMDLSKRRAASVKAELAKSFGVNGDRLETDGMGESKPVVPNDTPVNKALNRRVEFIKL
ncbi:MAG TPA: OmpA family protein [Prolixibacteraceae bacterium]|nr:OmpA family protein [Prolixibacteraceae bacterium]